MIPLAQWERLGSLLEAKVGPPWQVEVEVLDPKAYAVRWRPCANGPGFLDWSAELCRHLGFYLHLNRTGVIVGKGRKPFLRESCSYPKSGEIAPALVSALLRVLETLPDLDGGNIK